MDRELAKKLLDQEFKRLAGKSVQELKALSSEKTKIEKSSQDKPGPQVFVKIEQVSDKEFFLEGIVTEGFCSEAQMHIDCYKVVK